jgi:hypothetical protein
LPTFSPQKFFDLAVAPSVASNFGIPVIRPRFGHPAMLWTAVPKATVHKDGNLLLPKNKIRSPWHPLMATPAGDAMRPEQEHQSQLGVLIP